MLPIAWGHVQVGLCYFPTFLEFYFIKYKHLGRNNNIFCLLKSVRVRVRIRRYAILFLMKNVQIYSSSIYCNGLKI